jgi:hypothetical protein
MCDAERATPSNNHILTMNGALVILAEQDLARVVLSVENIIYSSATIIAQSSAPSPHILDAIADRRGLTPQKHHCLLLSGKALPGSKRALVGLYKDEVDSLKSSRSFVTRCPRSRRKRYSSEQPRKQST